MLRYIIFISVCFSAFCHFSKPAPAYIPCPLSDDLGGRSHRVQPEQMFELDDLKIANDRTNLIKSAAQAASASYNDTSLVTLKGRAPLRYQTGFKDRKEMLNDGHDVVSFSATIPGQGQVPAGIVTYKDGVITISYHGSECIEDFTEANLRLRQTLNDSLGLGGYVHSGFNTRFLQSREALDDVISDMLARHGKTAGEVKYVVTGHSLGAAIATLSAAHLKNNIAPESEINLVTFSSPRVLNHAAAASLENKLGKNHMLRIWRDRDPVPAIVLGILGYKHAGTSIKLRAGTYFMDLSNHDLGSIVHDAFKVEEVEVQPHEGLRHKINRIAGNIVKAPVNAVQSVVSKIGRWFKS